MTFDLRTHVRNAKGDITHKQPYRCKITNGQALYERPVGSGNWYAENGELIHKGEEKPVEVKEAKPEFQVEELEKMLAEAKAKQNLAASSAGAPEALTLVEESKPTTKKGK